ncbi:ABC transporter permease [Chitinophaga silvatica]|uniref:ABC transporter permease n=1 Tax=Chitinophaga silvatica TaxID=2282649 RepID=A0A3E1YCI9_9BACT|nr:ABC transporter permease [Chitinophaga silvatica]RFS24057.1 ABC transporter permease [Chitinophaga silvatica]
MFKRYLILAFRNLRKQRLFTFINIVGLAISMAVCLMVLVSLKETFSYDNFHPNASRIFRATTHVQTPDGRKYHLASTPLPLGDDIKRNYTDAEDVVSLYGALNGDAKTTDKELPVRGAFTTPSFFTVFGFKLKWGNAATVFSNPNSIVLTATTAERFFGTTDPIGKTMQIGKLGDYIVSGVLEPTESHSHIDFEVFAPVARVEILEQSGALTPRLNNWDNVDDSYTYVLMRHGKGASAFGSILARESHRYDIMIKEKRGSLYFEKQSFTKITPSQELYGDIGNAPPWGKVLAEALVALGLLLCACFNYVNLTIVRSLQRAKEVGIHKVNGAKRWQIFMQFIVESVILCLISLVLALILLTVFQPQLKLLDFKLLLLFTLFSITTGIVAGIIPAWSLSSFDPIKVLKNLVDIKLPGGIGLRKTLIVIQFTLSIASILFLVTVYRQFSFKAEMDMGFNRKDILDVPLEKTDYQLIKQRLLMLKDVEGVTASSGILGMPRHTGFCRIRTQDNKDGIEFGYYAADNDFIKIMGLSLVAGNNFPAQRTANQEQYIIVNEKATRTLGFKLPDEAVGHTVWVSDSVPVTITGVVKDFNYQPIEVDIRPMALRYDPAQFNQLQVKLIAGNKEKQVSEIQNIWVAFHPGKEMNAEWMDKSLKARNGQEVISLLGVLVLICTSIAGLGLLGIVSYTSFMRRKEISVRKILGADLLNLILLLSKSFIKLIFIASCIALPIGITGSMFFLRIFAYRVDLGILPMLGGFVVLLLLALAIISSQTWKSVLVNPTENLRND